MPSVYNKQFILFAAPFPVLLNNTEAAVLLQKLMYLFQTITATYRAAEVISEN